MGGSNFDPRYFLAVSAVRSQIEKLADADEFLEVNISETRLHFSVPFLT